MPGGQAQLLWLIVALVVALAAITLAVVLRFRSRYRAAAQWATGVLAADEVIRPLEKGVYRGATASGYPAVKNNGRIALTRRRLVFVTLTGARIEIPLAAITALRQARSFNGSVVGGYTHLVVGTDSGEIAFFVPDLAAWLGDLGEASGVTPAPS